MSSHPTPLKYLFPGWFAIVMGLCGLALAWHRAEPLMGEMAGAVALITGVVAAAVFAVLALASVLRVMRHPEAWREDRQHPVRHTFIAAIPVSLLLLSTVAVALTGPSGAAEIVWWIGCALQLFVTVWVLGRWWQGNRAGALQWVSVTPALLIPIVGNVLVPLAGVPLGHADWSAAQFGIGLLFWPVVLAMIVLRLAVQGAWPDRLKPTVFIVIAPPAVIGVAALQLGAPPVLAWMCWGMALFGFFWAATQARAIVGQPFGMSHWAVSFPLASLAALTLRLAAPGTPMSVIGPALLALASIVILGLLAATLRGLRDGSLLAPEPVAAISPAAA